MSEKFVSKKIPKEYKDRYISGIDINFPIRDNGARVLVVGKPGSGKSCLWAQRLFMPGGAMFGIFERVYCVMPFDTLNSVADHPFKDHKRYYSELTVDTLEEIVQECIDNKNKYFEYKAWQERQAEKKKAEKIANKKANNLVLINKESQETEEEEEDPEPERVLTLYNHCLIVDDWGSELKNKEIDKYLQKIFSRTRHLSLTVILLLQNYLMASMGLRKMASHLCFYKNLSAPERYKINAEHMNFTTKQMKNFFNYFENSDDNRFSHIVLNRDTGQIYHNFEKIPAEKLNEIIDK